MQADPGEDMRLASGRLASICYCIGAVLVSAFAALLSAVFSLALDWTILGMAIVCLMPGLCLLSLLTMFILAWGAVKVPETERQQTVRRENRMVRLATLAVLALASAGLSVLLLAVPSSSIWVNGLTLPQLRSVLVALSTLTLLLSFELPYLIVNTLTAVARESRN